MGKVITQGELNNLLGSNMDFGLGDEYCPTYEEIKGAWRNHKIIFNNESNDNNYPEIIALDSESGQFYSLIPSSTVSSGNKTELYLDKVYDIPESLFTHLNGRLLKKFYLGFNCESPVALKVKVEFNKKSSELKFVCTSNHSYVATNTNLATVSNSRLFILDEISDESLYTDIVITLLEVETTNISGECYYFYSDYDGTELFGLNDTPSTNYGEYYINKYNGSEYISSVDNLDPEFLKHTTDGVFTLSKVNDQWNINKVRTTEDINGSVSILRSTKLKSGDLYWGQLGVFTVWNPVVNILTDSFPKSGSNTPRISLRTYVGSSTAQSRFCDAYLDGNDTLFSLVEDTSKISYSKYDTEVLAIFTVYRKLINDIDWSEYFKSVLDSSIGLIQLNISRYNLYKIEARLPNKCMVRFRKGFYFSGTSYISTTVGLTATVNSSQSQTLIYNNSIPYTREAILYDAADSSSSSVNVTVKANSGLITQSNVFRFFKVVYINHNNSILHNTYSLSLTTSTIDLINLTRNGSLPIKAVSIDLFTSTSYTTETYGAAIVIDTTELSTRNTSDYCRIFTESSSYQLYFYLDGTMNPMWLGSTTENKLSSSSTSVYLPSGTIVNYELYDNRSTPYRTGTINESGTLGILKDSSYSSGPIRIKLKDAK